MVDETAATAVAGAGAHVVPSQHGLFAFGPHATVILLDPAVAAAALAGIDHAELFGPFPPEFTPVLKAHTPIELFLRLEHGCLALGKVFPPSFGCQGPSGEADSCDLTFIEPLPFDIVDLVRPLDQTPPPELGWLDHLPHDPSSALREFIEGWFADIPPATPFPDPPLSLPAALVDLYRLAAGRLEVLGGFNRIFPPPGLEHLPDGYVIFGAECQGVWRLLLDPTGDDPPVFYDHDWPHYDGRVDRWTRERERLNAFLPQFVLTDAAVASPFGGLAFVDADQASRFTERLRRVPMQPTRWPTDVTDLYVGVGIVALVCQDDPQWRQLYVGARRSGWIQPFREPGFAWEHFRP